MLELFRNCFLILSLSISLKVFAHGSGHGDTVFTGNINLPIGVPTIFPLPVNIGFDGNIRFGWDWWGFRQHHGETGHGDHDMGSNNESGTHHHETEHGDHEMGESHDHAETNDGGNHDSSEEHHSENNSKFQIHWELAPLLYLNADKYRYLINLSEHSLNTKSIPLEIGNEDQGFLVVEQKRFEVGIGVMAHGHLPVNAFIGFGILPSMGIDFYSERKVSDLKAAENLGRVTFPKDIETLKLWNDGDLLLYRREASISFTAMGGISGLSAGIGYTAKGLWQINLKKAGENKLLASVSKIKINSLMGMVGMEFLSLNLGLFGNEDNSFTFEFDLAHPNAEKAYHEFIMGKFKLAQKLANEGVVSGVERVSKSRTKSFGQYFGVNIGIPFLARYEYNRSKILSVTDSYNYKSGIEIDNTMGIFSVMTQTKGPITRRVSRIKMFSAHHQYITSHNSHKSSENDHSHKIKEVLGANIKWMYQRKSLNGDTFNDEMDDLKRMTGLWEKLNFSLPMEKLGLVKIEFDAMISNKAINSLFKLALDKKYLNDTFQSDSLLKIDSFFSTFKNPSVLCKIYRSVKICKKAMVRRTQLALKNISNILPELLVSRKNKNWKEFTKKFAELGKHMMENQFTFNTLLDYMGKDYIKMEFKITGDKLANYKIIF